jgi:hypothetical protein
MFMDFPKSTSSSSLTFDIPSEEKYCLTISAIVSHLIPYDAIVSGNSKALNVGSVVVAIDYACGCSLHCTEVE